MIYDKYYLKDLIFLFLTKLKCFICGIDAYDCNALFYQVVK